MSGTRTVAVAAAAAALALPAAGCGEESEAGDFAERYNEAVEPLTRVTAERGEADGSGGESNREIAADLRRFAAAAERTRAGLARLDAPQETGDELGQLVAALEEGIDDLRRAPRAARSNDRQGFVRAREAIAESRAEIAAAEQELKQAVRE